MRAMYAFCAGAVAFLGLSGCMAQSPSAKPQSTTPSAKQSSQDTKNKQPEWKVLVQQADAAEQKGNAGKARALLDRAYKTAPTGEGKAEIAFKIAALCERQKTFDEARRWYLEAIYAAPKGPLAGQARERMRALPDSRRPAAAGVTPAGGTPNRSAKPK